MKQKLDAVRTLAIKLYEAGQNEKRRQEPEIWGTDASRKWRDLPSESVEVWDAVATAAYRHFSKTQPSAHCSQCGRDWSAPACGPTHAAYWAELQAQQ